MPQNFDRVELLTRSLCVIKVMFMQWVQYKLWPTFEKQFPGKIMIPCCGNAPYHHNRGIPSLSGVTKKADVIDLIRNGVKGDDPNRFTGLPGSVSWIFSSSITSINYTMCLDIFLRLPNTKV